MKGFRKEAAEALVRERSIQSFESIDELARRVPILRKDEMSALSEAGALNTLGANHRRDALWKASRAARPVGPLLNELPEPNARSPLSQMTIQERLQADFRNTGVNIGKAFHCPSSGPIRCAWGNKSDRCMAASLWEMGQGRGLRDRAAAAGNSKRCRVHYSRG
ncbi:MAG: hypothetical protein JO323_10015 [Acidobacteriia bacterium]|nr:hypothetical protein [Terriglobia bacterium]